MSALDSLKKTCLALAITQTLAIPAAQAATIIVNTTGDTDGNDQVCTLREAIVSIHDSNPASKGCTFTGLFGVVDTVGFDPGLNDQVIQLNQAATLFITKNLIINGLGEDLLTIDGSTNGSWGIFDTNSATVHFNDLTISGGKISSGGGGIRAIDSSISLSNVTMSSNTAGDGGGGIFALNSSVNLSNSTVSGNRGRTSGGIRALSSSISLTNSIVSGNTASDGSGGGIGPLNSNVSLSSSTVSGNSAGANGGGIYATGIRGTSSVTLTNSTVSGNSAGGSGGGISAEDSSKISLFSSTVSSNTAAEFGGGIVSAESEIHFTNSTISENSANKSGGGILLAGSNSNYFMTLWHTTITNNTSGDDGGGIGMIGGAAKFTNSIVSGNTAVDLGDEIGSLGGIFIADRNNLFGDSSKSDAQAFETFSPDSFGSDITATSDGTMPTALASILQPALNYNGGPTKTHALVVGSPAINAGNPSLCRATDQRGENRSDETCDIGSYEFIEDSCYVIKTSASKTVVFCL